MHEFHSSGATRPLRSRSGVAAAILPVMAETALGDAVTRIELPWLSKYRRDIGLAWHERLLDTRPKARELLGAITGALAKKKS